VAEARIVKCLIIAAGRGYRLRKVGDSKPLIPVLGVPLIERVIRAALKARADDFYVTVGTKETSFVSSSINWHTV
jgi:NDP-sugar pyrophosphorylase family protein